MKNQKTEKLVQLVSYGALDKKKRPKSNKNDKVYKQGESNWKTVRPLAFLRRSLIEDEGNCLSVL